MVLGPSARAAEPADEALAEQLFTTGKSLMTEKKWPEACAKLDAARRLSPGIGISLWLAECYERGGRLASAWLHFREAATAARAKGDPRAKVAEGRIEHLVPRLSRVRVAVAPGFTGQVLRDDVVVPPEALGEATPVDPGSYRYRFVGEGGRASELRVEVIEEGRTYDVRQDHAVAAAPPPPPPPSPVERPAASPSPTRVRWPGWVAFGIAAAGVGIGSGLGIDAASKQSAADDGHCTGRICDAEGVRLRDAAFDSALGSTIAFSVAGVAAIAGVLVFAGIFDRSAPRTLGAAW